MSETINPSSKSPEKKKGFIRFEAVIPVIIIIALITTYYTLFFDKHLKAGIEFAGSYAYGAEIDIKDLSTSVIQAKLEINDIQLTDLDAPERNFLQIGQIRFQMSWDALLRAKFVIVDSAIETIRLHSPRANKGKIYRSKDETESTLEGAEKKVLQNAQETYQGNVFGDAASLLEGKDPADQLQLVESELLTKKKIEQIRQDLDAKEKKWKQTFESLPNKEKFKQLESELRSLNFNSKNPQEIADAINKGSALIKEAEQSIKTIEKEGASLKSDVSSLETQIKELEDAKKKDIEALQNRIQIPELDAKAIAMLLFGDKIRDFEKRFGRYIEMGREYIPADKDAKTPQKPSITPKERALGKSYEFPTKKSYPLFWLQQGSISSTEDQSSLSGNLKGKLTNLTSNQKLIGKPTVVEFAGEFPKENVFGINAIITSDHSGDVPQETLKASVKSYPVPQKDFSKSNDIHFGFNKATGSIAVDGSVTGKDLKMTINHSLSQIDYVVNAKSKTMSEVLQNVARDVPVIDVTAGLNGYWRKPDLSLQTNLASAIASSLRQQLKARIDEAKAKLTAKIDAAVGDAKNKLTNEFNQAKAKYQGEIENLTQQANSAKQNVEQEIDKAKNSKTKEVEDKAKKELENLRKKFKF